MTNLRMHGYAARFNAPFPRLADKFSSRPWNLVFSPGCFSVAEDAVEIWFMHRDWHNYGRGSGLNLAVWQDKEGLAFQFEPPSNDVKTHSLLDGVGRGAYCECSVGYTYSRADFDAMIADGVETRFLKKTKISEISIVPAGGCPGTGIWLACNEHDERLLPASARPLVAKFHAGRQRMRPSLALA